MTVHVLIEDRYNQAVELSKAAGKAVAELDRDDHEAIYNAVYAEFVDNFTVHDIMDTVADSIANEIAGECID